MALDVRDEQLEACRGPEGASETINTTKLKGPELSAHVRSLNEGRLFSLVVVTAGADVAYASALRLIAPLGRLIVVGLPNEPIQLPARIITAGCNR